MTECGDKDRSGGTVTVGGQIQIRGTVTELGAKDRSGEQ